MRQAAEATSGATTAGGQIRAVQALRAIAALFVVGFHSTVLWHDKFDPQVTPWENGNSGVDLFFVISGFIMLLSSRRLMGLADGWRRFIVLRLIRIAPMYWLTTTAKLASIIAVPAMALHTRPNGWNTVASFLFIPSRDAVGVVRPVLDVGWTLSFEMLFYVVFAAAMLLGRDPVVVVAPIMAALALASLVVQADWPTITTLANPLVLEFVFGLLVGRALMHGRNQRHALWMWMTVLGFGLGCLALAPTDGQWERVAVWGVAAAAVLYAAVLGEQWLGPRIPNLAVEIGEASYSLYLTHGFVLPVIGLVVAHAGLKGDAIGLVLVVSGLVLSTAVSLAVYRLVEVPMTKWLRRMAEDRERTTLAAPESPI